jgi:hypothetical protein
MAKYEGLKKLRHSIVRQSSIVILLFPMFYEGVYVITFQIVTPSLSDIFPRSFDPEFYTLMGLKGFDNLYDIVSTRIASGPEHAVNALPRFVDFPGQSFKCNCCIDIITKHCFARIKVSCQQLIYRFYQHFSSERGVLISTLDNCFPEASG